jgi:hypothetical protein
MCPLDVPFRCASGRTAIARSASGAPDRAIVLGRACRSGWSPNQCQHRRSAPINEAQTGRAGALRSFWAHCRQLISWPQPVQIYLSIGLVYSHQLRESKRCCLSNIPATAGNPDFLRPRKISQNSYKHGANSVQIQYKVRCIPCNSTIVRLSKG